MVEVTQSVMENALSWLPKALLLVDKIPPGGTELLTNNPGF
jgi:hypothetical protein